VTFQLKVEAEPDVIVPGETDNVIEGAITAGVFDVTVIYIVIVSDPLLLLQESEKLEVPVFTKGPVLCDPLTPFEPDHPPVPPAVQLVGLLVTFQLKVEAEPDVSWVGLALKVT
jgi:hypothetical protein